MGTVYFSVTPDGDRVAVKTIRKDLLTKTVVKGRFEHEILALGMIQGPRVSALAEIDRDDEVPQWLVTDYVQGPDAVGVRQGEGAESTRRDHRPKSPPDLRQGSRLLNVIASLRTEFERRVAFVGIDALVAAYSASPRNNWKRSTQPGTRSWATTQTSPGSTRTAARPSATGIPMATARRSNTSSSSDHPWSPQVSRHHPAATCPVLQAQPHRRVPPGYMGA